PAAALLQQALQFARVDPARALRALQLAAQAAADDAGAHREIARVALPLDPALALAAMARAVELAPANDTLRFQYASVLAHQGRHADALPHFQQLAPRRNDAQGWQLLGLTLQRLGRHGQALQALRRAHELA